MDKTFTPSPQQAAVFKWVDHGRGNAIVEAVAGAGKTATLARAIGRMKGYVCAMAYNKAAAAELKSRVASLGFDRKGVMVSTCHSVGFRAWMRAYPQCQVNEKKTQHIVQRMVEAGNPLAEIIGPFIERVVSLGTQALAGVDWSVDDKSKWLDLIEHYGAGEDFPEDVPMDSALNVVIEVFERSTALCPKEISFDDMLYAPIRFKLRMFQVDWVLLDEAQDSNLARRRLAKMILNPRTGRFIGVGDSRQAIYGFAGASSESLDELRRDFGCSTLPLTVSYRCPKSVIRYAHNWVQHIEAHETAPEGVLRTVERPEGTARWYSGVGSADAVLCRFTKPLVSTAYAMIKDGIACKVEGRDIGLGLIKLATRWKVKSLNALEDRIEKWLDKEVSKARAVQSETKEQAARDKFDTLHIFIGRCRDKGKDTVACLKEEIEALFADDVKGVTTLCTIHRSKGREFGTVWWMQTTPSNRRALKDWEQVQEDNLCYVAATRAMNALALVPESVQ